MKYARTGLAARAVEHLIVRELRSAFHAVHVCTTSDAEFPAGPIVLYANHHTFHDGYAVWYMARHVLARRPLVWMREWERFPFFGAAGAQPFPEEDPAERRRTIRRTRARFDGDDRSALIYFPEGRMHPLEDGVEPWPSEVFPRLHRILGRPQWAPVALYPAWRENDRPELFIGLGEPRPAVDGTEFDRLAQLLGVMPDLSRAGTRIVLKGHRSRQTGDFSRLARLFRRYL